MKAPVKGAVEVAELGLKGDEQADLTVHGGPDKAVYFYLSSITSSGAVSIPKVPASSTPAASAKI